MSHKHVIGVLGGTGFYDIEGFTKVESRRIETPYGEASDEFIITETDDARVVFLPRHGKGHRFTPTDINYRANIYGMKVLGVDWLISVSAVGSLREHLKPGHIAIADQFFDRTKGIRKCTFFGNGVVGHAMFADPVSPALSDMIHEAATAIDGVTVHKGGTYVCMEGPQFSTRAESHFYRSIGADLIGMTNLTEAKLAREAGIHYASMCLVTDYDCWRSGEDDVDVADILAVMRQNVANAKAIVKATVQSIVQRNATPEELPVMIVTAPDAMNPETVEHLRPIMGKYLP